MALFVDTGDNIDDVYMQILSSHELSLFKDDWPELHIYHSRTLGTFTDGEVGPESSMCSLGKHV